MQIINLLSAAISTWAPSKSESFHALDYLALIAYLAVVVGIGAYFSRREKTTNDYFLAGRRVPWWAASLSIFSTYLSAVTFMAIPAKAFATDWVTILVNLGIILATPVAVFCFLPFYRRLNVTTIYEYLEMRFSPGIRIYGSVSFVFLQLAKMGVFLLLPSLALSTVTGFNVYACIIIMGLLCTIYTVLGGIEAVIWTDVLQSCVLVGGGLLCIGTICGAEKFDFSGMLRVANDADKFHIFNTEGGIDSTVFWVVILGGFFIQVIPFTSDQVIAQRFLTTRDEKSAARSLWAHAGIVVPASLLFFGLGTALFVYYSSRPELLPTGDVKNDAIVPWFIATRLPAGIAGLVIAGVFAATMSTVDSGMHSIATSLVNDVYGKLRPNADDKQRLAMARMLTVAAGLFGTISAVLISRIDPGSLWEMILLLVGLFGSSLTGVFLLGVLTRRASARGVAIGVVASIISLIILRTVTIPIHGLLTAAVGVLSCVVVGYVASILMPARERSLKNLTLGTLEDARDQ
ncbi:MAG: sodium:solute symporter family protein [Planctomycetota bacterium]|jgi:SSS family transporter